jgi:hypothetical protein
VEIIAEEGKCQNFPLKFQTACTSAFEIYLVKVTNSTHSEATIRHNWFTDNTVVSYLLLDVSASYCPQQGDYIEFMGESTTGVTLNSILNHTVCNKVIHNKHVLSQFCFIMNL